MENTHNQPLFATSSLSTDTINGIKFTPREIDVLACILGGRTAKKIATFLFVSSKTIEKHIYHIMLKLECNSRESIKDFLENSNDVSFLKNHYANLSFQINFEKVLKELTQNNAVIPKCSLIYWLGENNYFPLFFQLEKHLKITRTKVSIETREETCSLNTLMQEAYNTLNEFRLFMVPQHLNKSILLTRMATKIAGYSPSSENAGCLLLLSGNKEKTLFNCSKVLPYQWEAQKNYYFFLVEILKRLFPKSTFEKLVYKIEQHYEESRRNFSQKKLDFLNHNKQTDRHINGVEHVLKSKKWSLFFLGFIVLLIFSYYEFEFRMREPSEKKQENHLIQSELNTPHEEVLLHRSKIMAEIDKKLKAKQGIQCVALVGIGGAGKTTIARWYARRQKSNIIWEINAETRESLKSSFEKLAHSLAKTVEDEQLLRETREIKNAPLREEKILLFVKRHLKLQSNWFLIYDNVENFADIQMYFPQDVNIWGLGKVIITTRNTTIQHNSWVNQIVPIGELTQNQKIDLFSKIINHSSFSPLPLTQQTISFLQTIPPFPLDISVAAYYLKATQISYKEYLKNIFIYNKPFENMQKILLKEFGNYNATRYSIITLSIKKLIDTDKEFGELFLFISLLDSQNIPRKLLEHYKSKNIVDNFIYYLKKYSLIKTKKVDTSSQNIAMLNIHRSTQEIALKYLVEELNVKKNFLLMESIAAALENYMTDAITEMDSPIIRIMVNHGERFLSHSAHLTHFMKASIQSKLGGLYLYSYYLFKAKTNLEEALKKLGKASNKNHKNISDLSVFLSLTYWDLEGNYKKGRELLEESLTILKKYSAEESLECARVLGVLGSIYRELGQYEIAVHSLEKSICVYKKHYRENHIRIIENLYKLGAIYFEVGDYKKAKCLLEKSFLLLNQYYRNNYRITPSVLGFLGFTYLKLHKYEKAIEILNIAYSQGEKYYPKNNYVLAWIKIIQGKVYGELGQYEKAKNLMEQSFCIWKQQYGHNHFEIARLLRDLSRIYFLEGNLTTSKLLITQSLAIFQQHQHPELYSCFEALAELSLKKSLQAIIKKDVEETQTLNLQAIQYFKQALEVLQNHFPKNSPHRMRIELKLEALVEGNKIQ